MRLREGERARRMSLMDQARENFRSPDTALGNFVSKFNFTMFMGTNFGSQVQEAVSMPLIIAPMAVERGAGIVEAFTMQKRAMADMIKMSDPKAKITDPRYRDLIDRAKRENTLTAKHLHDFDESFVENELRAQRIMEGKDDPMLSVNVAEMAYQAGSRFYQITAERVAKINLIVGFELAKKNMPDADFNTLYNYAVNFHGMANGAMGRAGRPIGLSSGKGVMRSLGQMAMSMQSFSNAHISNWIRLVGKSIGKGEWTPAQRNQARKALGTAVAMNLTGLGMMGFPLALGINAVFKEVFGTDLQEEFKRYIFEWTPGDDATKAFVSNFAAKGALYAFNVPGDLQSRLAVGGAFAVNGYEGFDPAFYFGAVGELVNQTKLAMGAYARGDTAFEKMAAAGTEFLPIGIRRLARLAVHDGQVLSSQSGKYMYDASASDVITSALGITPRKQRMMSDQKSAKLYWDARDAKDRKQVSSRFLDLQKQGKSTEAEMYLQQKAKELAGVLGPETTEKSIRNMAYQTLQSQSMPFDQSVGTTRFAPMINAMYGQKQDLTASARYLQSVQNRIAVGLPDNFSNEKFGRMQQADLMMDQNQILSPGLAEAMLTNPTQYLDPTNF
jgi:hypothetical protein